MIWEIYLKDESNLI